MIAGSTDDGRIVVRGVDVASDPARGVQKGKVAGMS